MPDDVRCLVWSCENTFPVGGHVVWTFQLATFELVREVIEVTSFADSTPQFITGLRRNNIVWEGSTTDVKVADFLTECMLDHVEVSLTSVRELVANGFPREEDL